jgi:putative transcriptional regulator
VKRLLCAAGVWLVLVASGARAQAPALELANGVFLVAQPTLTEPTFRRTVILITQRPDGGSLGVIINRPTQITLAEAFPQHEHIAALAQPLHFGGPVQPQALLFLVRSATPPPGAIAVLHDVYLTADADWVDSALATQKIISATRAFAGYAGWAPRQLRSEMERQGWYILPADAASVFDSEPDALWIELAKRAVLRPVSK